MAVAEASIQKPPTPKECEHPAPVTGIMAHEFSPYQGAQGPEGARRTTMFYGPVVGGLPIDAWHCEQCGLLRLHYADGRDEERILFPGPQPGLLALPTPADAPHTFHGRQPRVSGLSAEAAFFDRLEGPVGAPLHRRIAARLPDLGFIDWMTVAGLVFICLGLLAAGYLSVNGTTTSAGVAPLVELLAAVFAGVVLLQILGSIQRRLFPPGRLAPSIAVAERGKPEMDGATTTAVWLLSLAMVALLAAGILAVYDYQTPAAEGPVFAIGMVCGAGAIVVMVVDAVRRHFSHS